MVQFSQEYLAKQQDPKLREKLESPEHLKDFIIDLAGIFTDIAVGNVVMITGWRKHWLTKDLAIRKKLLNMARVQLWIGGQQAWIAPLSDVPTHKWGRFPGGDFICRLPANIRLAMATNEDFDPRPHVAAELRLSRPM